MWPLYLQHSPGQQVKRHYKQGRHLHLLQSKLVRRVGLPNPEKIETRLVCPVAPFPCFILCPPRRRAPDADMGTWTVGQSHKKSIAFAMPSTSSRPFSEVTMADGPTSLKELRPPAGYARLSSAQRLCLGGGHGSWEDRAMN